MRKPHLQGCVHCVITPCISMTLVVFFFNYYFHISLSLLFPPAVWLQHLRVIQIPTLPTLRHLETQQFHPIWARHPPQSPFHQVPPPTICFFFHPAHTITFSFPLPLYLQPPSLSAAVAAVLFRNKMYCFFKPQTQQCLFAIFGMFWLWWGETPSGCFCLFLFTKNAEKLEACQSRRCLVPSLQSRIWDTRPLRTAMLPWQS